MKVCFRTLTALLIGTGSVLFAADKPAIDTQTNKLFTSADNGKAVDLRVGENFVIRLTGSRAQTGWEYGEPNTAEAVKIVKREFVPEQNAADPAIGTYSFHFTARAEGVKDIVIRYVYPGGPGVGARLATELVGEFKMTIRVIAVSAAETAVNTMHASLAAYPNAVITANDAATGTAVAVEPNGRELKATEKDGVVVWKVDVVKTWGNPSIGEAVIRHLAIRNGKVDVTVGKAMGGTVDLKTGKATLIGED